MAEVGMAEVGMAEVGIADNPIGPFVINKLELVGSLAVFGCL
jgi:hypothetical protein